MNGLLLNPPAVMDATPSTSSMRTVSSSASASVNATRLQKSVIASLRRGCSTNVSTRAMFSSGYAAGPTHSSRLRTH